MPITELNKEEKRETSGMLRAKVEACRHIQEKRYREESFSLNAEIPGALLDTYCNMTDGANERLIRAFVKKGFSARLYDRIRRVSRTVADLEGSEIIREEHVSEAVMYHAMEGGFNRENGGFL